MSLFIGLDERKRFRETLKHLAFFRDHLTAHIETRASLAASVVRVLSPMVGSTDPATMLRAVTEMHDNLDKEYDKKLLDAAPHKLSHFCEFVFRNEPPAHHHEYLIDKLESIHRKEIMRCAISAPPGSAKSSYSSIRFPAWHLGRRPNDRWLQGAHTQTFAKDRLGKPVRALIKDSRYRMVFPEMLISDSSAAADYFEFGGGAKGYFKAIGVGVGISGYRADIAGIDDPIASREEAESATAMRKLHDWFDDDFSTRPMPGSPMYIVNTRWTENDLVGHLLQKQKDGKGDHWEIINIPALAEENDPLGRAPGEGLWEGVFGTEFYLARKRSSTGRSWNSLYMGKPTDEAGGVLKFDQISRYKQIPEDKISPDGTMSKKVVKKITLSVDCAEKATKRSDWTAATVWIETYEKKHYLVDAQRCRKEFTDLMVWIEEIAAHWDVSSILCEDRGAGTQYIQVRQATPGRFPVIPIATMQKSKEFRFDGVTPMFSTGVVLLPESGTDWIADVEAELLAFPGGKNDDFVDSVSQYLARARETGSERRGVRKIRSGQTSHR